MATLSSVSVDFIANVSKYIQGLTQMSAENKKFAAGAKKDFDGTKGGIDGMAKGFLDGVKGIQAAGAALAALGLAKFAKDVMESASKVADLSDELRISTESIQALESIFEKSGNKLDDIRTIFVKLQKSAIEAADGNKNLNDQFVKLGINVDTFNKLSPDDKLTRMARGLASIEDPAERAAIAQDLLGKNSGKTLAALMELADKGSIKTATDGIFVNSKEAIDALDKLGDSGTNTFTNLKRYAIEAVGQIIIASENLSKLQQKFPPNYLRMGAGIGGTSAQVQAAIEAAPKGGEKSDLQIAREEQALIRQSTAALKEKAEAIALQQEAFRKVRDSILASIDPEARYRNEVDKINETVNKNKLSEQDRAKMIAAISNAYIYAVDPIKKYEAEIAKINADKGLTDKQKQDNIRLLAKGYFDIIEPTRKYEELIKELDFFVLKSIITDKEKKQILDNLGSSYRQAYDVLEKYRVAAESVGALPPDANVDKAKYIQSLGDAYRKQIDPLFEYQKQLDEISALNKVVYEQNIRSVDGTLLATKTVKALSDEEAKLAASYINVSRGIELQRQIGVLAADDMITAQAKRNAAMFELDKIFRDKNLQSQQDLAVKSKAVQEIELQYFKDTHKEMTSIYQNMGNNIVSAFEDMLLAGKSFRDGMHDVFMSLIRDLMDFLLKQYVFKSLFNAVGGSLFGIQNMGQLMYGGPRASGGSVNAGTAYTVGETGPEMFVPKTAGYIIPNGMGGNNSNVTVVQNISVETGVSQTVRAEMAALLPKFKNEAMAGVLDAKSRGGSYGRAFA